MQEKIRHKLYYWTIFSLYFRSKEKADSLELHYYFLHYFLHALQDGIEKFGKLSVMPGPLLFFLNVRNTFTVNTKK